MSGGLVDPRSLISLTLVLYPGGYRASAVMMPMKATTPAANSRAPASAAEPPRTAVPAPLAVRFRGLFWVAMGRWYHEDMAARPRGAGAGRPSASRRG